MKCQSHRHDTTINSLLKYTYIITYTYTKCFLFLLYVSHLNLKQIRFKKFKEMKKFKELKYISFY